MQISPNSLTSTFVVFSRSRWQILRSSMYDYRKKPEGWPVRKLSEVIMEFLVVSFLYVVLF